MGWKDKIKDYLNCDISKNVNPDKIVDLGKKIVSCHNKTYKPSQSKNL